MLLMKNSMILFFFLKNIFLIDEEEDEWMSAEAVDSQSSPSLSPSRAVRELYWQSARQIYVDLNNFRYGQMKT